MSEQESIYKYTWSLFEEDVESLRKRVDFSNYDYLCGIATGGLPLLTKLTNITKKPYIIIECSSYEGHTRKEVYMRKFDNLDRRIATGKRFLLIDDVADSGMTFKLVADWIKWLGAESVETLALFYKPHSIVVPEWYTREVENHQWIEFPWE